MDMTPDDYEAQALALLPRGPAWSWALGAPVQQLGAGWAYSLARVHGDVVALIDEADPSTTFELLSDWERVAGLPDPCALAFGGDQELGQRQASLLARITSAGGQTPAYYIAVAESMGYDITITEFHEHTVDDDVDAELCDEPWAHAWSISAQGLAVTELTVDDTVDDPLAWWGDAALECVFERIKPAHTVLIFTYEEA